MPSASASSSRPPRSSFESVQTHPLHPQHARPSVGLTITTRQPTRCRLLARRIVKHTWVFLHSAAALLSAIMAWLGVWELFDLYFWPRTVLRDLLYVLASAGVMAICGTYLPNCGIYEDDDEQTAATAAAFESADEIEKAMGLASPTEGDQLDWIPTDLPTRTFSAQTMGDDRGVLIEMPSPSVVASSLVSPRVGSFSSASEAAAADSSRADEDDTEEPAARSSYSRACVFLFSHLCSWRVFLRVYFRSLVSLLASVCFWTGAYNLLLEFFLLLSAYHEVLSYTLNLVLGWFMMWKTDTLFEQAGLTEEEEPDQDDRANEATTTEARRLADAATAADELAPPPHAHRRSCLPPRVHVYVRASIAITGCMMFWLGASMLLELLSRLFYPADSVPDGSPASTVTPHAVLHCDECEESTPARNAIFVFIGLACFLATNTMAIHAGVEESNRGTNIATGTVGTNVASEHAHANTVGEDHVRLVSVAEASASDAASSSTTTSTTSWSSHPVGRHLRALASLLGVMLVWEGIWDAAFNAEAESVGWPRMVVYTVAGLVGLMCTNSLFSNSGVVPPFAMAKRSQHLQQRLGFHLQEKRYERAEQGGFAHQRDVLDLVEANRTADDANHARSPIAAARDDTADSYARASGSDSDDAILLVPHAAADPPPSFRTLILSPQTERPTDNAPPQREQDLRHAHEATHSTHSGGGA